MILGQQFPSFPFPEVAVKIGVSLAAGLLVGLERQWAQKEVGVRTFAITSLIGTLSALVGTELVVASLFGVLLLVTFLNVQSGLKDGSLELTTSAAMLAVLIIGALVGQGHYFTAATSSILMTMLLTWKLELSKFAGALHPEELRSAVLLGLLSFVIYPLLPDRFIDPWELLNPRQAWITVLIIAGIGFLNYVLLRLYGAKGMFYAALLGGLVNSTATAVELSVLFAGIGSVFVGTVVALIMVTNISMFVRNLVLLAIFAKGAVPTALPPIAAMIVAALLMAWLGRNSKGPVTQQLKLTSPVSLRRVVKFGLLFIGLSAVGTLAQRFLGDFGFLVVSVLGGLVSSASTTATAAALVAAGKISPEIGGMATVLTSIASSLVDLPLVYQQVRQKRLVYRLAGATAVISAFGLAVLFAAHWIQLR
jgi:uncharacterized membrane protein (DUF4010 family)